ncbi:MAG: hypothetical protein OSB10_04140, partial [Planctomycetota bacterium]|nr:hypothetical protein [Planctomycetota bacterium]
MQGDLRLALARKEIAIAFVSPLVLSPVLSPVLSRVLTSYISAEDGSALCLVLTSVAVRQLLLIMMRYYWRRKT